MGGAKKAPGGRADSLADGKLSEGGDGEAGGKAKGPLVEAQGLASEDEREGREACFKEEERGGRGGDAAGYRTTRRMVEGFKGLQVFGVGIGIPARRSVSQGGEKKGSVDRSKGLLGGAPGSGGNSPERFQSGVAPGSQGRAMG